MQMRGSASTYLSTSTDTAHASSRSRLRTKPYGKRSRYRQNYGRYNTLLGVVIGAVITVALTAVYYLAIREHDVELSFDQKNELDWQTVRVANHSMYLAKPSKGDLVSALPHSDWAKVSQKIEWVVYYSSGTPSVEWTTKIASIFAQKFMPPNLGIIKFPCGCVVPNAYLTASSIRFHGSECAMLPGFVFPHKYVHWIDSTPGKSHPKHCMHPAGWFARHEEKLEAAGAGFEVFKENVIAKHAAELTKTEGGDNNDINALS